jgi:hypothetical protein
LGIDVAGAARLLGIGISERRLVGSLCQCRPRKRCGKQ